MELLIKDIVKGISRSYGEAFFKVIAQKLDKVIHSDYTFIARIDEQKLVANTVVLVADGKLADNFSYDLAETPCQKVTENSTCIYPRSVAKLFPHDYLLADMQIEAYLGAPLINSSQEVIGIVVALYKGEITDAKLTKTLFELFSGRIAVEFERLDKENELQQLNNSLDIKVRERTQELETALADLHKTQDKLVEAEKMAALGDLVAGVAHEVNTPLGVAITAESHLCEYFQKFKAKFEQQHLSIKDMQDFVETNEQSLPMISRNLERAKELVINFKALATEQADIKFEQVAITAYYRRVISTLTPLLKRKKAVINFTGCDNDVINTFPGCHAQLLTNLVTNSIQHGFSNVANDNIITITLSHENDSFVVNYQDNGQGINSENQSRIFEPFYTASTDPTSTGLGLSVAYNLASHHLKGSLEFIPTQHGVHFKYCFTSLSGQSC
ncbi:ATP-binding protein [Thalassotalea sp. PLHSN55]|uniref:ATP-binding protein n=1 Tax=Thalassotalea sp. PLHSN55 TaxID=3435888 RepID=UPI003F8450D3